MFSDKTKIKSRALALTVALALFLLAIDNTSAATSTVNQLNQKAAGLTKTVTNTTAQSQAQKAQAAALQKDVSALDGQIAQVVAKISVTGKQVDQTNADVTASNTKIATETQNLAVGKKKLGDVLSDWYMKGSPSFSEQMVATGSLSQFIDQAQYYEAIRSQISEQIAKVRELKLALENTKKDQEKQLADLKNLKDTQTTQRKNLAYSQASKQKMASTAVALSSKYAAEAQAASAQLTQVNGEIRQAESAAAAGSNNGNRNTITRDGTSTRGFVWPISNFSYGCPFGYSSCYFTDSSGLNVFHSGMDLIGDPFTAIKAAKGGTVISVTENMGGTYYTDPPIKSYGNNVRILHEGQVMTLYGHLASVSVSVGQTVVAGQVIGSEGTTGYSTGFHLHFEVRYGATSSPTSGTPDNPEYYLP